MVLDGLDADVEGRSNLLARRSESDLPQDFRFSRRQASEDRPTSCDRFPSDRTRDVGAQRASAARQDADRLDEFGGVSALGYIAAGAGFEGLERQGCRAMQCIEETRIRARGSHGGCVAWLRVRWRRAWICP